MTISRLVSGAACFPRRLFSTATNTVTKATEATASKQLYAQVFLDLNWIEKTLTQHVAPKKFGDKYAELATIDFSALRPFLQQRLSETLGYSMLGPVGDKDAFPGVKISHMYGYGSFQKNHKPFDVLRAATDEMIAARNFPPSKFGPSAASTVAMAVDMVHSCAIRGPVDTGVSLRGAGEAIRPGSNTVGPGGGVLTPFEMHPTQFVVAAFGSPLYFPALVRSMQHDRTVVVASTKAEWGKLAQIMVPEQRDATIPILLDDALNQMVVSLSAFKAAAIPQAELAARINEGVARVAGAGSVTGLEVAAICAELGLLKQLRQNETTLKTLVSAHKELFEITRESGDRWEVRALKPPATPILPVADAKEVAAPTPAKATAPSSTSATTAKTETTKAKEVVRPATAKEGDRTSAAQKSGSHEAAKKPSQQPQQQSKKHPQSQRKPAAEAKASTAELKTETAVVAKPVAQSAAAGEVSAPVDVPQTTAGTEITSETAAPITPDGPSPTLTGAGKSGKQTQVKLPSVLRAAAAAKVISEAKATKENFVAIAEFASIGSPEKGAKATKDAWQELLSQHLEAINTKIAETQS